MKKWILALSLIVGILGLSACNNSDTIAETKAGEITKEDLYNSMKDRYGKQMLQEMIYYQILSDKYDVSDDELKAKVKELQNQYGMQLDLSQMTKSEKDSIRLEVLIEKASMKDIKVTEKELKEEYEKKYPQINARHILVKDEKTAKEVKQKLDNGSKFEDLAKEYSKDTGSAENGGDLGWFGPGDMVKEFSDAAFKLKKNEISQPVKTEYGYHIIQLIDAKEKPAFKDVKDELEKEVKKTKMNADPTIVTNALKKELKAANVKINDKDLKDIIQDNSEDSSKNEK